MVVDSYNFGEEPDLNPLLSEKSDPGPHLVKGGFGDEGPQPGMILC